jgi:bifunctional non-homologous end joining protein LigD
MIQAASESGSVHALVFFLFDLLYLDGEMISAAPLRERKERLRHLLSNAGTPLQFSDHQTGRGSEFYTGACELSLEGIISKREDAPYSPGNRGLWVKVKCQNREEFVVVGWTDPEGTRPGVGALLLAYYDPAGRLVYAGRVGTGIDHVELGRPWRRLQPLATSEMPLEVAPPRTNRFGLPLVLSHVHWVRPELVVEVKYLTWTEDNLLRQVVYEGLREDKRRPRSAASCHTRNPLKRHADCPVKTVPVPLSELGGVDGRQHIHAVLECCRPRERARKYPRRTCRK